MKKVCFSTFFGQQVIVFWPSIGNNLKKLSNLKSIYPMGLFREKNFIEKKFRFASFYERCEKSFWRHLSVYNCASCQKVTVGVNKTAFYTSHRLFSRICFLLRTVTVFLSVSDIERKNFNHLSSFFLAQLSKLQTTRALDLLRKHLLFGN